MTLRNRAANWVAGAALALGIAGTALFCDAHGQPLDGFGSNLPAWIACGLIALAAVARRGAVTLDGDGKWMALPALFFAATFIWRADPFLQFWNFALLCVSGALLMTRCRGPWRVTAAGYTEYVRLTALAAWGALSGPFRLPGDARPPRPAPGTTTISADDPPAALSGARRAAGTVAKGALLSVVPLAVFGSLFASADPIFARDLQSLFDWNFPDLAARTAWTLVFAFATAGLLRTALLSDPVPDQPEPGGTGLPATARRLITAGDVQVALALIDLLFAAFVIVQFNFLFGGDSVVRGVSGLNYSTYARGGFFELAWVAGLALPVLLVAHWITAPGESDASRRRIRALTGALVFLLMVIVASAFKRMALYEAAWGMTEKRLLVSVFIGAITVVFLWFLATVWCGRPRRFAFGLLVASMLTIGGLDLVNTDAWVVRLDAAREQGLRFFTADYLAGLGADAVPALASSIDRLSPDQQPYLAAALLDGWGKPMSGDWRRWNAPEAAARAAVAERRAELAPLAAKAQREQEGDAPQPVVSTEITVAPKR